MISGIVVALPEELATLTSKRIERGHCAFIGNTLLVAYSGVGGKNAGAAAEMLVGKGATQLISWGCAGALNAHLNPGDLVLAHTLVDSNDVELAVSPDWHGFAKQALAGSLPIHTGRLAESIEIVSSDAGKQQLHSITGAAILDMESVAVAKAAKRHGLPFLSIRAVVDPASMNLPLAISYASSPQGEINLGRLLLFLLFHPLEIPGLIRLAGQFAAARKSLQIAARHLDNICEFYHHRKTAP